MNVIKLSQVHLIQSAGIDGQERIEYEPIYIQPSHIESFFSAGRTVLRMTSGDRIEVKETPEYIISHMHVTLGDSMQNEREMLDAIMAEQRSRKSLWTPKVNIKPALKQTHRQAIAQAKIESLNSALAIVRDKLRLEKSERMRIGMLSAISEIERIRDEVRP
ncbi:hypothetical protein [Dickeya poaceiphila]|uniref:Flagellar FlbD family protein n=1 Tax=Dickeya poaceiphila TaxID=568768 RepID=A0A5B8I4J8_9GAMM|nr:hypothetical protein [Dickeya poaceiphila]QDX29521.1 flagellar FlbD family protein [Dickeya poaceiphila]